MDKPIEKRIIELINKDELTKEESLELIDNLYWADWDYLQENYANNIEDIFKYIEKDNLSNEEISQILRLYNNPDGSNIEKFSSIISNLYKRDKVKFIKSLNLDKEEALNLVYLFRNHLIELDEDKELLELTSSDTLSEEEKETAKAFIKAYENACST